MSEDKKQEHVSTEMDPHRESVYEAYEKMNGGSLSDETTDTAPEDAETGEEPGEPQGLADNADSEDEKYEPAQDEKKKEEKTVPYEALHEEREKRKTAQTRIKEVEEQNKILLQDLKKLLEGNKNESTSEEIDDYDKVIKELRAEVKTLKEKDSKRDKDTEASKADEARKSLEKRLSDTDSDLSKEGFPGFKFMKSAVAEELNRLIEDDPENRDKFDNPEGWKRIYKEKVFPEAKGAFSQKEKDELFGKKKDAKSKAGLIISPGKSEKPSSKDDDDNWSYADYIKMRQGKGR